MQPLTGHAVDSAQLTQIINHYPLGTAIASPRFQLLDQFLAPLPTNTVGVTGDPADISWAVMPGSTQIDCNTSADVPQTLTLRLREARLQALGIALNPILHNMAVYWDYWDGHGELLAEIPLGVFTFVMNGRTIAPTGTIWNLAGSDLTMWLKQVCFENSYVVAAGSDMIAAAVTIATMSAIEKSLGGTGQTPAGLDDAGAGLPASRVAFDPLPGPPGSAPYDITLPRTSSKLAAVASQLLGPNNYYSPWATNTGILRSTARPYYNTANGGSAPQATWAFTTDVQSIITGSLDQQLGGAADLANVLMAESSNPAGAPLFAIARNTSTDSSISRPNLGRSVMPPPLSIPNVPDQATLNLAVLLEAQRHAQLADTVTFPCAVVPVLEAHDFVSLTVSDANGHTIIGSDSYPFEVLQYSIQLDANTMSVTLGKSVAV